MNQLNTNHDPRYTILIPLTLRFQITTSPKPSPSKPSLKNHSTYKMLVVLSISQKDYEYNTIPQRRNPHLFQNKETSAKKTPVIRAIYAQGICVKFSIKNAATYQQKSIFSKFSYLFPHKHLQIYTIRKTHDFSTRCASWSKAEVLSEAKPSRRISNPPLSNNHLP